MSYKVECVWTLPVPCGEPAIRLRKNETDVWLSTCAVHAAGALEAELRPVEDWLLPMAPQEDTP